MKKVRTKNADADHRKALVTKTDVSASTVSGNEKTETDIFDKISSDIEVRRNSSPVCFAESDEVREEFKTDSGEH